MEKMDNKERYISLLKQVKRDGINDLLAYLEKSDFYYCPASAQYHGNYSGGLLQHSLNVYDEYERLIKAYSPEIEISEDSIIIMTLLHDLCKVNLYVAEKRNRKNAAGAWESYDAYGYDEKFCFGGHGSKSLYIAQNYIKLTPIEAVAINCHMGCWDGNKDVGKAYEQYPAAWLLHVADESATYTKECKK